MVVGIDTMVVIYAGLAPSKAKRSPEAEELRIRALMLLNQLRKEKCAIILPAICVAEILVPVAENKRGELAQVLADLFDCRPFDLEASAIAAKLRSEHDRRPKEEQYEDRVVLKADSMILATACVGGATKFFTNDDKMRRLGQIVIDCHPLPKDDPTDIFAREDLRRGTY